MSQHDYDIANASGASVRADINSALQAIATLNSGSTAPSTTFANQLWMDTSTTPATLKLRNTANSAWITVGQSASGLGLQAQGANVASASTTNIWSTMDGISIHITGTTTITSFGTAPQAGAWKLLIFDGVLTLTHNASTLVLPSAGNETTVANQMYLVYADTTTKMLIYPVGRDTTLEVGTAGQLQYTNTTTLTLVPFNGYRLYINGSNRTIPAGGITITTSGLSANTLYYIYAYMSGSTMTLEISTTAPAARETTTGIRYKTSDTTRTLVGMARTNASTQFAAATTRSWFNRQVTRVTGAFSTNRTTTSTSMAEVNTETRADLVCWDDDQITTHIAGLSQNSGGSYTVASVYADGSTEISARGIGFGTGGASSTAAGTYTGLSTGYHYLTIMGAVQAASTGTYVTTAIYGGFGYASTIQG